MFLFSAQQYGADFEMCVTPTSILGKSHTLSPRLGEALWTLRPWPELKLAFLGVVKQTHFTGMAVANVAGVRDLGDRPNQPASFNFLKWTFGQ